MAKKYSESFLTKPEARRPNELIIVHISHPQDKGDIRTTQQDKEDWKSNMIGIICD